MILDNTLAVIFGIASITIPTITAILLGRRSSTQNQTRDLERHAHPNPQEYIMMEEIHSVRRWHAQRE
ncbi:hypothetical protein EAF04_007209 [Stromatinia cepivora]|nr:hypothetical protein EAF04_007209 [Stromatinia cepivora]